MHRLAENALEKPPNYGHAIEIDTGTEPPEDESEATALELGPNNCAAWLAGGTQGDLE